MHAVGGFGSLFSHFCQKDVVGLPKMSLGQKKVKNIITKRTGKPQNMQNKILTQTLNLRATRHSLQLEGRAAKQEMASRQLKSPRGIEGFAGKFSPKSFNPPNYIHQYDFYSLTNGKRWFWLSEFHFSQEQHAFCFLNFIFFPPEKTFFHFFLVILPSCSKLCQSSKRQCGFLSPHATCCFWVVFFPVLSFSLLVCLCLSQALFVVLVLCLLFLFFVLLVWWFVLFPKRLRVGIQRPQWGKKWKKHPWRLSKRLVVLTYIGGLSFFFLPYRFGGLGERGGIVLLHVNDPPFFHNPTFF